MEKQQIKIQIILSPESFHPSRFYDDVLEYVKRKEMTCDVNQGYIDQIFRVVDLGNMKLSDTGECYIEAIIECMVFKPCVGKSAEVRVVMVSEHGIFSEFGNHTNRFLVPFSNIENDYDFDGNGFRHKHDKNKFITKGDVISVVISNFRFSNKCFCCIATLETRGILNRNFL